jgi:hypothetical protein
MELNDLVNVVKDALLDSKMAYAAFSPKALGIGRGKGVILAQLPDGNFVKIKITLTTPETDSEE